VFEISNNLLSRAEIGQGPPKIMRREERGGTACQPAKRRNKRV